MSSNEAKRFFEALETEEGLHTRFEEIVKRVSEAGEAKSDAEVICIAAKELGYTFTAGDLERFFASGEELDPDELESAAGGVNDRINVICDNDYNSWCTFAHVTGDEDEYGHSHWCVTAWHCLAATLHTESKNCENQCWSHFLCAFVHELAPFKDVF